MRPQRLSLDPNSPSAGKEWKHWIQTFENYLASFPERAEDEIPVNKLHLLTNSVAYDVYNSIEECVTYESAIRVLENLYVKTPNEIFARHLLATARQAPGQSLNDFIKKRSRQRLQFSPCHRSSLPRGNGQRRIYQRDNFEFNPTTTLRESRVNFERRSNAGEHAGVGPAKLASL